MWSARGAKEVRRCAAKTTVRRGEASQSAERRSCSVGASAADVGSSATRSLGRRMRARAMPTRCRSPPEMRPARSPTTVSAPFAKCAASSLAAAMAFATVASSAPTLP
mmetsp:Transcript_19384/g.65487  ORF Transcript_19384/g.65487 Transcript_19384/m.65487 type:complete len:108 (-) Transcript_19384:1569-1892(-)